MKMGAVSSSEASVFIYQIVVYIFWIETGFFFYTEDFLLFKLVHV
jgi:hypothetical protein